MLIVSLPYVCVNRPLGVHQERYLKDSYKFFISSSLFFSDTNTIKRAIENTTLRGYGRNQALGLRRAQDILYKARTPSDRYVILVTTGAASLEEGAEKKTADRLTKQGVKIIVLGKKERLIKRLAHSGGDY